MIRSLSLLVLILGICGGVLIFVNHSDGQANDSVQLTLFGAQSNKTSASNLLDRKENEKKLASTQTEKIPASLAEFRLAGIIADDAHLLRAIIAHHGEQAMYRINDVLPVQGKVVVTNILPDRVIINNTGLVESLPLSDQAMPSPGEQASPSEAAKEVPIFYGRTMGPDEPQPYVPNVQEEEHSLANLSHNFSNLMKLSILRNENTHQLLGYKISKENDVEKFNKVGLQDGDMITAINGIPVTKADDVIDSFNDLAREKIALEIERDGSVVNLEMDRVF